MVRFEQRLVQAALDHLRANDVERYNRVMAEWRASLNGVVPMAALGRSDRTYANALQEAKEDLDVDEIDPTNEDHRVAIGDALTDAIRRNERVVCTGSRIARDSCP